MSQKNAMFGHTLFKSVKMVEAQGVKDDSDGCANVCDRTHISQTTKQFPVMIHRHGAQYIGHPAPHKKLFT